MAKRRSLSAERFDLPLEDPKHRQLRDDAWIGGPCNEAMYYLGWLQGRNPYDEGFDAFLEKLKSTFQELFPQSPWLHDSTYSANFFLIWIKAKYRESHEGKRFPIRRPPQPKNEKAVILLMENPALTDEDIRRQLNTTEKQMQRWTDYKLARTELTRYQD
jgi:hypothetical protein